MLFVFRDITDIFILSIFDSLHNNIVTAAILYQTVSKCTSQHTYPTYLKYKEVDTECASQHTLPTYFSYM